MAVTAKALARVPGDEAPPEPAEGMQPALERALGRRGLLEAWTFLSIDSESIESIFARADYRLAAEPNCYGDPHIFEKRMR